MDLVILSNVLGPVKEGLASTGPADPFCTGLCHFCMLSALDRVKGPARVTPFAFGGLILLSQQMTRGPVPLT